MLTVLAGALALLCFGGAGVGYLLYDKATRIDRSAPDVTVDNYLRALLVEDNQVHREELECSSPDLGNIAAFRAEIRAQEKRLDTSIGVSWGSLLVQKTGPGAATVQTTLRRSATVDGVRQSLTDDWRFNVVEEDGWRVCGAEKVS